MILLFTDYGLEGPYTGQVETVLHTLAPQEKVINLMADAPRNNPRAGACLLASVLNQVPQGSILFCVVDPGVGSGEDAPVALQADNRWLVGPDNGLFDLVCRRAGTVRAYRIVWQPAHLSGSFHGRDLYAPVCAAIVNGESRPGEPFDWQDRHGWPEDLDEIV
ncbi:MAG: SAM-dependent chlorinase/fluorinase, partial [Thiotrichales bacterium]|nr:SAM-dependent chlorinase/fluorinase [Thiotrichales bacterium]